METKDPITHRREEGEAGEEEGREEVGVRPPSVQLQQGWRMLRRPEVLRPANKTSSTVPMATVTR